MEICRGRGGQAQLMQRVGGQMCNNTSCFLAVSKQLKTVWSQDVNVEPGSIRQCVCVRLSL